MSAPPSRTRSTGFKSGDGAGRARRRAGDVAAARSEALLPTEEDFEKTMGYMERFFRRFMGIVKDFEKDGRVTRRRASRRRPEAALAPAAGLAA